MPKVKVKVKGKWYETNGIDWDFELVYLKNIKYAIDFDEVEAYKIMEVEE